VAPRPSAQVENCHFALRALRPVSEGEELLFSYGAGYWLARGGHYGIGTDLKRVGSGGGARGGPNERLKAALAASRPQKGAKKGAAATKVSTASSKARARKKATVAKKGSAKGFGR
jgi:hypothetical protein